MAREITYNNFETSLVVFTPNITTNHATTYTYHTKWQIFWQMFYCEVKKSIKQYQSSFFIY